MKANEYLILSEAIEAGVARGWHLAHKHTDSPTEELVKRVIEESVMAEICQYFIFEDLNNADHT